MLFVSGSLWITGIKFHAQFIHIPTREKWFISTGLGENCVRLRTTPGLCLGKRRFWIMGIRWISLVFAFLSLLLREKFGTYPARDRALEKVCMGGRIIPVEKIGPESHPLSTFIHRADSDPLTSGCDKNLIHPVSDRYFEQLDCCLNKVWKIVWSAKSG